MRRSQVVLGMLACLLAGWFLGSTTRPAVAQDAAPQEATVPRAYGTLKAAGEGALYFEAPDGTIRIYSGGRVLATLHRS